MEGRESILALVATGEDRWDGLTLIADDLSLDCVDALGSDCHLTIEYDWVIRV